MKNWKLSSLLASLLFVPFLNSQELDKKNFPAADPVAELSDISQGLKLEIPQLEAQSVPEIAPDAKAACQYPNEGIYPGKDLTPAVSDEKRVNTILTLILKISNCQKLPYKEDGSIFKNKEKKLPAMSQGYYHEYTVVMPKDSDKEFYIGETHYTAYPSLSARGPERIVIGGGERVYYTPTHYDNFIEMTVIPAVKDETGEKQEQPLK